MEYGQQLDKILEIVMCEPRHLQDFFSEDNTRLNGWTINYDEYGVARQVVYRWNAAKQIYEPEIIPTTSDEVMATPASTGEVHSLDEVIIRAMDFYAAGEIDSGVDLFKSALGQPTFEQLPEDVDRGRLNLAHYYLGFLYEAANRPDEALAEYVSIYESAPDSAWGMLAALHLEKIEE
jgi:hypothetical protein